MQPFENDTLIINFCTKDPDVRKIMRTWELFRFQHIPNQRFEPSATMIAYADPKKQIELDFVFAGCFLKNVTIVIYKTNYYYYLQFIVFSKSSSNNVIQKITFIVKQEVEFNFVTAKECNSNFNLKCLVMLITK